MPAFNGAPNKSHGYSTHPSLHLAMARDMSRLTHAYQIKGGSCGGGVESEGRRDIGLLAEASWRYIALLSSVVVAMVLALA
jgi:hypothetical protein